jgi:hypothetical protein
MIPRLRPRSCHMSARNTTGHTGRSVQTVDGLCLKSDCVQTVAVFQRCRVQTMAAFKWWPCSNGCRSQTVHVFESGWCAYNLVKLGVGLLT